MIHATQSRGAITIAMQLGLQPIPAKTAKNGRKHIPEGYQEKTESRQKGGTTKRVRDQAAERRKSIFHALRDEPMSSQELQDLAEVSGSIIEEDVRVLAKTSGVKKKMHKGENIYWVSL